ncbi:hypothetical protein AXX17_AT1G26550 [Arabidopsis thaliana]|uniref:Transmembrane protein n=1 Tax=Arabidopsis thaliana TaxID=3702 RepID=A0A178WKL1_ARATH|nr:hypothetical protein AXX17_AT1G26550 [Arabidopsis thaliana]
MFVDVLWKLIARPRGCIRSHGIITLFITTIITSIAIIVLITIISLFNLCIIIIIIDNNR